MSLYLTHYVGPKRLYTLEEVSGTKYFGHDHILTGYRTGLTTKECLRSIFQWHNETISIWTHAIGFVYVMSMLVWENFVTIPRYHGNFWDHVIVSAHLLCSEVTLLSSACCHIFGGHRSPEVRGLSLRLDLFGIFIGVHGFQFIILYYGICDEVAKEQSKALLLDLDLVLFAACDNDVSISRLFPHCRRITLTALQWGYGAVPIVHAICSNGGLSHPTGQYFCQRFLGVVFYSLACLVSYTSQLPERLAPGWFDYVGQSHHWWHMMVLCGIINFNNSALDFIQLRQKVPCS
uniref:Progestin and adipoQ receptor family member 3 n=1 Tax=Branchiostoma floridae TaxID=7739 RepID=C3Y380_BRAFL|eukprot:XP_002609137.1 hypothetical protein BRAFLDRAFT_249054 [Branchiostoma floridae]